MKKSSIVDVSLTSPIQKKRRHATPKLETREDTVADFTEIKEDCGEILLKIVGKQIRQLGWKRKSLEKWNYWHLLRKKYQGQTWPQKENVGSSIGTPPTKEPESSSGISSHLNSRLKWQSLLKEELVPMTHKNAPKDLRKEHLPTHCLNVVCSLSKTRQRYHNKGKLQTKKFSRRCRPVSQAKHEKGHGVYDAGLIPGCKVLATAKSS